MKELSRLARLCMAELDAIGIPYHTPQKWIINTRARHRFGQCHRVRAGVFEISVSVYLLNDTLSDIPAMNTIMHELLHTVDGCADHGERWKSLASRVNAAYPKYNIKRTSSWEEYKITPPTDAKSAPKYMIECELCGMRVYRTKVTKVVKCPENYRCRCGGKIFVAKL